MINKYIVTSILLELTSSEEKKMISESNQDSSEKLNQESNEEFIENNNTNHIIIRPSTVYGEEDNFFNLFGKMAKILPFLPLFRNGTTRFQPIYINDA